MAELSDPDATDPTFTADQTGIYIAQLIVADDFLESEPGTVVFTISNDVDEDYMDDSWEQQIVDADPDDAINTIESVLPDDDFDGDGISNIFEYNHGLDPLADDSMQDLDGDCYPNIYELRGTNGDPNDAEVFPTPNATVSFDGSTGYATLQAAIDAVSDNYSIILVQSGTYTGSGNPNFTIDSDDPKLLIVSSDGAESTILDGESNLRGAQIEGSGSGLAGFTIRNCSGADLGGGLYIAGDDVIVVKCTIHGNSASNDGGGIYIEGNQVVLSDCEIY